MLDNLVITYESLFHHVRKYPDKFAAAYPNLQDRIKAFAENYNSAINRRVIYDIARLGAEKLNEIDIYKGKNLYLAPFHSIIPKKRKTLVKMTVPADSVDSALSEISYEEGADALISVYNDPIDKNNLCIIYTMESVDEPEESTENTEAEEERENEEHQSSRVPEGQSESQDKQEG